MGLIEMVYCDRVWMMCSYKLIVDHILTHHRSNWSFGAGCRFQAGPLYFSTLAVQDFLKVFHGGSRYWATPFEIHTPMWKINCKYVMGECDLKIVIPPFIDLSRLIGKWRSHDMDYFRHCSCLETNPCVLVYFPDSRRSCHSCRIWNSTAYFEDFTVRYGLKKSMNGLYKTNIDYSFIRRMVENYCTLGKTHPWPIPSPRPGLGEK